MSIMSEILNCTDSTKTERQRKETKNRGIKLKNRKNTNHLRQATIEELALERGSVPADAVPSTTGCVLVTLRSQIPSLWPTYSLTSWHTALDVVALKLDTI